MSRLSTSYWLACVLLACRSAPAARSAATPAYPALVAEHAELLLDFDAIAHGGRDIQVLPGPGLQTNRGSLSAEGARAALALAAALPVDALAERYARPLSDGGSTVFVLPASGGVARRIRVDDGAPEVPDALVRAYRWAAVTRMALQRCQATPEVMPLAPCTPGL
jgi:hypothetical protein